MGERIEETWHEFPDKMCRESMEKRYLIKEQGECDPGIVLTGTITDPELDNRLIAIYKLVRWGLPEWKGMFLENAKNILLHGEKKEE